MSELVEKKRRIRTLIPKWISPEANAELVRLYNESGGLTQVEIIDALVFGYGQEGVDRAWKAKKSAENARLATLEGA